MKKRVIFAIFPICVILLSGCTGLPNTAVTPTIEPTAPSQTETPSPQPTAESKEYLLNEVEQHSTETDCWMAINGKVYNVTEFVSKHPGGKAILNGCGKDATVLFTERPTNNKGPHPAQAMQQLEQFYIGNLKK